MMEAYDVANPTKRRTIILKRLQQGDDDPTDVIAFRRVAQNPLGHNLEDVKTVLLSDDPKLVRETFLSLISLIQRG